MIKGNATFMYSLTRRCRPASGYFAAVVALIAKDPERELGFPVAWGGG